MGLCLDLLAYYASEGAAEWISLLDRCNLTIRNTLATVRKEKAGEPVPAPASTSGQS